MRNADGVELKFNPWHDPENGRFTFAGDGRRYGGPSGNGGGRNATSSGDLPARPSRPKPQSPAGHATPKDPTQSTSPADSAASSAAAAPGPWAGGGFLGGGGGSSGGVGASGNWEPPEPKLRPRPSSGSAATVVSSGGPVATTASPPHASTPSEQFRKVVRNGYIYEIDSQE